MQQADFLIENAARVVTCAGAAPRRGAGQRDVAAIDGAVVAARNGVIVHVGPADTLDRSVHVAPDTVRLDARGGTVVPGFVDPHTHVVFAGDRRDEFRLRLAGASYTQIAAAGGGIVSTVARTRAASEDELVAQTRRRLDAMLACGTTTCEAKSGYGLTLDAELKQLRVLRRLDAEHPIDIVPTFLGAHEIPPEYRADRAAYVSLVIDQMIPRVVEERLAEYCDVFCESGVFTPGEAIAILTAATRAGLKARVHADELGSSGGSRVAAQVRARSADHLVFVDQADADALAAADVAAILLPTASFYLKLGRYAPARMLIERGVPVALATDINPGGGFSPSMPFAMTLACCAMDLTVEEALIAATINAAWSLDRAHLVGSLEPGKAMDAVIIDGDLTDLLRTDARAVAAVVKRGMVVSS